MEDSSIDVIINDMIDIHFSYISETSKINNKIIDIQQFSEKYFTDHQRKVLWRHLTENNMWDNLMEEVQSQTIIWDKLKPQEKYPFLIDWFVEKELRRRLLN